MLFQSVLVYQEIFENLYTIYQRKNLHSNEVIVNWNNVLKDDLKMNLSSFLILLQECNFCPI